MHVRSAAAAVAGILLAGLLSNAQMSAPHALPARVLSGDISLKGKISPGIAQDDQRLTLQEAIAAAQRNAKPGSSFTVLREIVANADTRRVGDQALEQAQAKKVELYQNGILADLLRSGGFLLAETDPRTTNMIATHLVSLRPDGVPEDAPFGSDGVVKLADAEELVKDTAEFTQELLSTPPSDVLSLESKFYGGRFPECGQSEECTLFAIPNSLLKLGGDQGEYRQVVALYAGINLLGFQYALSLPTFAANPLVATQAAADKCEALKAQFLRESHMAPDFDFDPQNIQSKEQLSEQIDILRRLNNFMEEALHKESDPALIKANIPVATISLQIGQGGPFNQNDKTQFSSATASLLVFFWHRLATGGFAVKMITEAG